MSHILHVIKKNTERSNQYFHRPYTIAHLITFEEEAIAVIPVSSETKTKPKSNKEIY